MQFSWNGRQIDSITFGSAVFDFGYNGEGLRIYKKTGAMYTKYTYEGNLLILEEMYWTSTGEIADSIHSQVIHYIYDNAGSPIGFRTREYTDEVGEWDTYFYEKNLQGDIVRIYNSNGVAVIEYTYDAWGNYKKTKLVGLTSADRNGLLYRGYYYDTDLGLYYLGSRYYDANIGRFISPDDIGYLGANGDINAYNLYAYCSNNPVMYSDPTGTSLVGVLIFLGVMMIAGGVTGAIISEQNEDTGFEKVKTIAIGAGLGLALGGAIVAVGGVFVGAIVGAGAEFFGIPALQAFAVGSLAFDFTAFVIAPLFGLHMEGIEYENPSCNYGNINAFLQPIKIG